jgi:hypothetical protein
VTLGTGTLSPTEPGLMRGEATFEVRGTFPLWLDCPGKDRSQNVARLRVGLSAVCQVLEFHGNAMDDEPARYWHGHIEVEGYQMRVRIVPGAPWSVEFHDCKQRDAARYQVVSDAV